MSYPVFRFTIWQVAILMIRDITGWKRTMEQIDLTDRNLNLMNEMIYQDLQITVTGLPGGSVELSKDVTTNAELLSFFGKKVRFIADTPRMIKICKD